MRTRSEHTLTVRAGATSSADPGPAPMELMLASLATCAAATIESIIERMRLAVDDLVVAVEASRAERPPRVWTDVLLRYHVRSPAPAERIERAATLAERTCSASVMLQRAAAQSHEVYLVTEVQEPETIEVRHDVLRSGMPREAVRLPGDADARWFGVLHDGRVLGTAGLFDEPSPDGMDPLRLRGMATAERIRGTGLGGMLLDAVLDRAKAEGAESIWASARTQAAGFYLGRGFSRVSEPYEVEGLGPHVRMRIEL